MRPLKLTMKAFGPYASVQTIDFAELQGRTMFVISGPTGAGKTTVFDAISYAVYGKASGEDRTGADLRSQFADEAMVTEVELDFELRGKQYRIVRTPQQERKKARGEGTTTAPATAQLYELKEKPELLASKIQEVDEQILQIVQLTSNQFRQIMMIPQGEFRKLLTSDSRDKEVILQKLFRTEHYKFVENELKEQAAVLREQVEIGLTQQREQLSQIDAAEPMFTELLQAEAVDAAAVIKALQTWVIEKKEMHDELRSQLQVKEQEREKKVREQEQGTKIIEDKKALQELKEKRLRLEGDRPRIEALRKEIEQAYKTFKIDTLEKTCRQLRETIDQKRHEEAKKRTDLVQLQAQLQQAEQLLQKEKEREFEQVQLQEEITRLQDMQSEVMAYHSLKQRVEVREVQLQQMQNQQEQQLMKRKQQEQQLVQLKERKQMLSEQQLSYMEAQTKQQIVKQHLDVLSSISEALQEEQKLALHVQQYEILVQQQQQAVAQAEEAYRSLEDAWYKGQASRLAASLAVGQACPVCGSEHHPQLAEVDGHVPTEEHVRSSSQQLQALQNKLHAAISELKKWEGQWEAVQGTRSSLQMKLYDQIPSSYKAKTLSELYEGYQQEQTELQQEVSLAARVTRELQQVDQQIRTGEETLQQLHDHVESAAKELEDIRLQQLQQKNHLALVESAIPEALRSQQAFSSHLQQKHQQLKQLKESLARAEKHYSNLQTQAAALFAVVDTLAQQITQDEQTLAVEKQAFQAQMQQLGFANFPSYQEAKRTDLQIQQLTEAVEKHERTYQSTIDRIHDLQERLSQVKEPNMEQLSLEIARLRQEIEELANHVSMVATKLTIHRSILERLQEIQAEIAEHEKEYKMIGHLADMASGKNVQKITFERYVLAAFLEEILQVANVRLLKMTNGRYELRRKQDRSKGHAQSGLELLIFDQYTGAERHVKTLSGGESFKASLSLALGLAEVVQSVAGGISLETMFIDEGFGTLDPESLDNAIEALIDIQSSGRLVGVISHVPELKERIDARLEVSSSQQGSTARFEIL